MPEAIPYPQQHGESIDRARVTVEIQRGDSATGRLNGGWDALLARSDADSVFLSSAWLGAWTGTLGRHSELLLCSVQSGGELLGAAVFENRSGVVGFAGRGPSDYADIIVQSDLNDADYLHVIESILSATADALENFRSFQLLRIPARSRTVRLLETSGAFFGTRLRSIPAPILDMSLVEDRLRKKSLRRHTNGLKRQGDVQCSTLAVAEQVLPLLEPFFDQHIRRWHDTDTPSLFLEQANRDFFRAATLRLGASGTLRFTPLTVDGTLAAAHFGFMHDNVFTWYKPSFDVSLARHSPGEVLLKYLLERAREEKATAFDFTIGDEAFKLRFASEIREVVAMHVTGSQLTSMLRRARLAAGRVVRSVGSSRSEHRK